jgi:hypothetical protein
MDKKIFAKMAEEAYYDKKGDVDGWKYIDGTDTVKMYQKGNERVYAYRGTNDFGDVKAWAPIATNSLSTTKRYKKDMEFMDKYKNDAGYTNYGTGHSLGGALVDEFESKGYISKGITFNPAYEPKYRNNPNNLRVYDSKDPLFNIYGKYASDIEIDDKPSTWYSRIAGIVTPRTPTIEAHGISRFTDRYQSYMDSLVA